MKPKTLSRILFPRLSCFSELQLHVYRRRGQRSWSLPHLPTAFAKREETFFKKSALYKATQTYGGEVGAWSALKLHPERGGAGFVHVANVWQLRWGGREEGRPGSAQGGSEVAEDLPLLVPVHLRGPLVDPLGPYFLFGFRCRRTQVQAALFKGILFAGFSHLQEGRADRGGGGKRGKTSVELLKEKNINTDTKYTLVL